MNKAKAQASNNRWRSQSGLASPRRSRDRNGRQIPMESHRNPFETPSKHHASSRRASRWQCRGTEPASLPVLRRAVSDEVGGPAKPMSARGEFLVAGRKEDEQRISRRKEPTPRDSTGRDFQANSAHLLGQRAQRYQPHMGWIVE